MEKPQEKTFTVTFEESELELLLAMCRRSFRRTRNKDRRRMLGFMCDGLDATLSQDMLARAMKNIEEIKRSMEQHQKAEKRKHLMVVK